MNRNFDDILNECLDRIASGDSIQRCVSRYPEHAVELVPLLRMASATSRAAHATPFAAAARERGRRRLTQALANGPAIPKRRAPMFSWIRDLLRTPLARPMLVAFVAVMVTAIAAGGTTMASSNSVPGEPLYWVKTTKESITLRFRLSDMGRSEEHVRLASVRGDEMHRLMAQGNFLEAEKLVLRVKEHLNHSAAYAGIVILVNPVEMPGSVPGQVTGGPQTSELKTLLERNEQALSNRRSSMLQDTPSDQRLKAQMIMGQYALWHRIFIVALEGDGPWGGHLFFMVMPAGSFEVSSGYSGP